MIDIFFAMIAAGINSTGDGSHGNVAIALVDPAAAAVETPKVEPAPEAKIAAIPLAKSPSVIIGENVNIGANVVIGGNASQSTPSNTTATGGGLSLLDGTSEDSVVATPQTAALGPATSQFNMSVVPAGLVADPQESIGKFTTAAEVKPIMNATKGNWVAVREYDGQDLLYITHIWGWRCGLKAMAISVNGETMQNWPLPPCHMKFTTPNAMLGEDGLPYLRMKLGAVQTIDIQIVYDDLTMDAASFERGNVLIP